MKKNLLIVLITVLGLFFANNSYSQGVIAKAANNSELSKALQDPNVNSVEITQEGFYEEIQMYVSAGTTVAYSKSGDQKGVDECTLSITKSNVCFESPLTQNSASADAVVSGAGECPLQPTSGAFGWTVISKPAGSTLTWGYDGGFTGTSSMADQYDYNADFEVNSAGQYTLEYRWNLIDFIQTEVIFFEEPTLTLTSGSESCETIEVEYSVTSTFSPPVGDDDPILLWEVTDGLSKTVTMTAPTASPFTFDPSDYDGDGLAQCGDYTIEFMATNDYGGCPTSTTIDFHLFTKATNLNAGIDQEVCEVEGVFSTPILGSYTAATCGPDAVAWTRTGGNGTGTISFVDASASSTTVSSTACGEYELTYTVTSGGTNGCETVSTTTINFYDLPENVDAGDDQDVCEVAGVFSTPILGSYTDITCGTTAVAWTHTGGTGQGTISFVDDELSSTTVSSTACGEYELTYTVTSGGLDGCETVSTTTVNFYDLAENVSAGEDQEVCEVEGVFSTPILGSFTTLTCGTATVAWTHTGGLGSGDISFVDASASSTTVSSTACGEYELTYTVTTGGTAGCATVSKTTIYFYDLPENVNPGIDQEVCEDVNGDFIASLTGTYGPDSDPTANTVSCNNAETPELLWTKVSGPGEYTFTHEAAASTDVEVDQCGTYVFAYWVTNGPSCSVSNTVTVDFYSLPDNLVITAPEKVCGYTMTDMSGAYDQLCDANPEGTTVAWTTTDKPLNAVDPVIDWVTDESYPTVTVTTCGEYEFTYTVTNINDCETTSSTTVTFYQTPEPSIDGDDEVYTCSTVEYSVIDAATCNDPQLMTYTWIVTGGLFANSSNTTVSSTVNVTWDQYTTDGLLELVASVDQLECTTTATPMTVTKMEPTFAGQIKYWNEEETYMPTPFPTNIGGTFPEDYFYVELWGPGLTKDVQNVAIEKSIAQPRLMEDLVELMSYYSFTIPTETRGCDANYDVKVWDGGLSYHPGATGDNIALGASYTYTNWGGVNATDALAIQMMAAGDPVNTSYPWVGLQTFSPEYGFYSNNIADVNTSTNGISALDALIVNYRAVGLLGTYPNAGTNMFSPNFSVAGRMVTSLPEITFDEYFDHNVVKSFTSLDVQFDHSGEDYYYFYDADLHKYTATNIPWEAEANYMNIYYAAEGDINASYVPTSNGFKAQSVELDLVSENNTGVQIDQIMTIPISVSRDAELNAISLFMTYRNDLIEVIETNYEEDYVFINNEEGILNIGWFNTDTRRVETDEVIAQIKVRVLAEIPQGTELFELTQNSELADALAHPISDISLKTLALTTDKVAFSGTELTAGNHPNPFNNATTITYTLPESGKVKVQVINNMGSVVSTITQEVQEAGVHNINFNTDIKPGIYFYTIVLQGETNNYSTVKRMIVVK